MMAPLTATQRAVFDFVAGRLADTGRAPTIREIALEFDFKSPNAVMCHVSALAAKGWLADAADGASRGLSVPGLTEHLAPFAREFLASFAPSEAAVPS